MKLSYNSPIVLNFSFACALVSIINFVTRTDGFNGLLDAWCSLGGSFYPLAINQYFNLFLYPLNHADFNHLIGNLSLILLLGPILEEKYGIRLFHVMLLTTITTAVLNIVLFSSGIIGASGIVFSFIILSSITNRKEKSIPLTFVIIFLLYVGKEVFASFENDQVSQFGHIMGGIVGAVYGLSSKSKSH